MNRKLIQRGLAISLAVILISACAGQTPEPAVTVLPPPPTQPPSNPQPNQPRSVVKSADRHKEAAHQHSRWDDHFPALPDAASAHRPPFHDEDRARLGHRWARHTARRSCCERDNGSWRER